MPFLTTVPFVIKDCRVLSMGSFNNKIRLDGTGMDSGSLGSGSNRSYLSFGWVNVKKDRLIIISPCFVKSFGHLKLGDCSKNIEHNYNK